MNTDQMPQEPIYVDDEDYKEPPDPDAPIVFVRDKEVERLFSRAIKSYQKSDSQRWVFSLFCNEVVGKYKKGGTKGLASEMNVSDDTVENNAHAYWIYAQLKKVYPQEVRQARKHPKVYLAHFRALYKTYKDHKLDLEQIYSLLEDIVQSNGKISSRDVENHSMERFGDKRDWQYYAKRIVKEIQKTITHPDTPPKLSKTLLKVIKILPKKTI